jgi:steroid 5-alpha reductase family enzyme
VIHANQNPSAKLRISMILLLVCGAVLVSLGMMLAWAMQRLTRNAGWVDVCWTFSTGLCGVLFSLAPIGWPLTWRSWAVALLVAFWSLRLGLHIARRTAGGTEDPRYTEFRHRWADLYEPKMFGLLQIQALFAFVPAVSMLLAARNPVPSLRLLDVAALVVLMVALVGEAVSDRQMQAFRADRANKGQVCDTGLWRYSRHPNYFFEWLGWVAYPLFAIDASWPWGWIALCGPAVMYWLLVHISGIPPLEAQMLKTRPDAFRAYQRRTNAFFPGPNRALTAETSPAP